MKILDVDETGGGCSQILGPCNTDFLFIHNHLSEFLTEEDKKKARRNLGFKDAPTEWEEEINRLDDRITNTDNTLTTKIEETESELSEEIKDTKTTLIEKIGTVETDLTTKIDSTKSDLEKIIIDDEYTTSAALNEQKELINKEAKDIADLSAFSANLSSEVNILKNLKIKEKTATDPDVYKTYGLYSGSAQYGDLINIPKDKSLKDTKLGYANATVNATTGEINIGTATSTEPDPQHLIYSMALADGTYSMINIDLTKFFSDKEYSDGLELVNNVLKVKKDPNSEKYLSISSNGVKVSGIDDIKKTVTAHTAQLSTIQDSDGNLITVNSITARGLASEDFVDLGLPSGTLWMKCNIGANSETDYGLYFQWGDVIGYTGGEALVHSYWKTCPGNGGNSSANTESLTSWNSTNLTNGVLNTNVDAVYAHTGGRAKMPTTEQLTELKAYTNNEWTTINNINGWKFTSKTDTTKYIFIPAAGHFCDGKQLAEGTDGCIWSNTLYTSGINLTYYLYFTATSSSCRSGNRGRQYASTVRGVAIDEVVTVNLPSKSGTIALQADVDTINTQITSIDSQLADINEILLAQYTKVSLSASPRIIEKGTTNSISLSWNCTFNDKTVTPTSMQLKSGSTVIASTGTSYTDSISDSKSYYVTAVYNRVTKTSSTVTVNAYYPVYVNKGGADFDETTILTNPTKYVQANKTAVKPSITYETGEYGWFCYPNGYGDPKSVKVNGFDVTMQAVQEVTINGVSYRAFRTYNAPNPGTINYEITF